MREIDFLQPEFEAQYKSEQTTSPRALFAPRPKRNGLARWWSNGYNFIKPADHPGLSSLRIVNGTESDAIVKMVAKSHGLTQPGTLCRYAFICAKSTIQFLGLGPGRYTLLFCLGTGWDPKQKGFAQITSVHEFAEPMDVLQNGFIRRHSANSITLHAVAGGKARTYKISPEAFHTA